MDSQPQTSPILNVANPAHLQACFREEPPPPAPPLSQKIQNFLPVPQTPLLASPIQMIQNFLLVHQTCLLAPQIHFLPVPLALPQKNQSPLLAPLIPPHHLALPRRVQSRPS